MAICICFDCPAAITIYYRRDIDFARQASIFEPDPPLDVAASRSRRRRNSYEHENEKVMKPMLHVARTPSGSELERGTPSEERSNRA
jgi:hypothetical protein